MIYKIKLIHKQAIFKPFGNIIWNNYLWQLNYQENFIYKRMFLVFEIKKNKNKGKLLNELANTRFHYYSCK